MAKEEKKKNEINVEVTDEQIIVERGEDFIEGEKYMEFGFREYIKDKIQSFKSIRVKGDDDYIMTPEDYEAKNNPNFKILGKMLTAWSNDDNITLNRIKKEKKLTQLFDEFIDRVKDVNNLKQKKKDDEAKNSENEEY